METLKDLVATCRTREGTAFEGMNRSTPYSYHEFATNCWKAGNLFGQHGAYPGGMIGLSVETPSDLLDTDGETETPAPIVAAIGGTLIGSIIDLTPSEPFEAPLIIGPTARLETIHSEAGCTLVGYGGKPTAPDMVHFEAETWSQNPIEPPENVAADTAAMQLSGEEYTHEELLSRGRDIASQHDISAESVVGLAGPLSDATCLLAGVIAPLIVGGTVLLGGDSQQMRSQDSLTHIVALDGDCVAAIERLS